MILIIIFLSFLIWNVLNETLLLKYHLIGDKKFQRLWHLYDAIFRVVLFGVVIINDYGFELYSLQLLISSLLSYHVLFDLSFNYKRFKDLKREIDFYALFRLGGGTIDSIIRKIGSYFSLHIFNRRNNDSITHTRTIIKVNFAIRVLETLIVLYLIMK